MTPQPTFSEALKFWAKLGFISFGGPAGQIATMQHELVDERRWIGQDAFLQALNFCMLLPGPEAQQLATYVGWKLHGLKGALAAGILFVLPGALLLYALSWMSAAHGDTSVVQAVFAGLKPVVVAVVLHATWKVGRRVLKTPAAVALAVAAFLAMEFGHIPFPFIIILVGAIGWVAAKPAEAHTGQVFPPGTGLRLLRLLGLYLVLLLVPLGTLIMLAGAKPFADIGRFFTQTALVTFGGAYAILPYVADAAVNQFHWLDSSQMINGLALAETTPGPLILVLQFVGFFAGWNADNGLTPMVSATLAAGLTTYVTFLPSIMLIVAGAPYIEDIARVKRAAGALTFVTAAVVGVIATLATLLGRQVIFTGDGDLDSIAIAIIAVAFVVLWRVKNSLHWVILGGVVFGLVRLI